VLLLAAGISETQVNELDPVILHQFVDLGYGHVPSSDLGIG
jgi:hypothetical protein